MIGNSKPPQWTGCCVERRLVLVDLCIRSRGHVHIVPLRDACLMSTALQRGRIVTAHPSRPKPFLPSPTNADVRITRRESVGRARRQTIGLARERLLWRTVVTALVSCTPTRLPSSDAITASGSWSRAAACEARGTRILPYRYFLVDVGPWSKHVTYRRH